MVSFDMEPKAQYIYNDFVEKQSPKEREGNINVSLTAKKKHHNRDEKANRRRKTKAWPASDNGIKNVEI